jgi:hypothetical protein
VRRSFAYTNTHANIASITYIHDATAFLSVLEANMTDETMSGKFIALSTDLIPTSSKLHISQQALRIYFRFRASLPLTQNATKKILISFYAH